MAMHPFAGLRTFPETLLLCLVALGSTLSGRAGAQDNPFPHTDDLQAVVETSAGTFVLEFYPDKAPSHVAHFIDLATDGFYDGTTLFSMVPNGIVQGGDPLTRDPDRRAEYGTGGFHMDLEPEFNDVPFDAGTVVATLLPGDPASGGSQFFICVADQPQFTGQFTAFGAVVEGLDVLTQISNTPTDDQQIALERVEILDVSFRPRPPPPAAPFSTESVEELAAYTVVMETSLGNIVLGMLPELAPNHVRHFLRLVSLGVYDKTAVHRVVPGFVVQAGDLNTRTEPYPAAAAEYVVPIAAEPNDRPHTRGIVSLARGEDPNSGMTSFFIVLADQPALDGLYTVFGEVLEGMDVVDRIAAAATRDERPLERIDVYTMRVERRN